MATGKRETLLRTYRTGTLPYLQQHKAGISSALDGREPPLPFSLASFYRLDRDYSIHFP